MTNHTKVVLGILLAVILAAFFSLYSLSTNDQTPRETTLIGIILTLLSVLATWIASHWYAKQNQKMRIEEIKAANIENLKMFGLKAAEKVMNSSNELTRLSGYLNATLERVDEEDAESSLKVLSERIDSAIHLVQTIKSINDTSLSDWQGVIGEELNERREEEEERTDKLIEIIDRFENVLADREGNHGLETQEETEISHDIRKIKSDLSFLSRNILQYPHLTFRQTLTKPKRVIENCPVCETPISLRTNRRGQVRYKGIDCPGCQTRLVAHPGDDGQAVLSLRQKISETVACPWCSTELTITLENIHGANEIAQCPSCGATIRYTRSPGGIAQKILDEESDHPPSSKLSSDFLEIVEVHLPPQPWPTSVHKEIAEKLGVSNSQVSKAIKELINRGKFQHQESGVVCEPTERNTPRKSPIQNSTS